MVVISILNDGINKVGEKKTRVQKVAITLQTVWLTDIKEYHKKSAYMNM